MMKTTNIWRGVLLVVAVLAAGGSLLATESVAQGPRGRDGEGQGERERGERGPGGWGRRGGGGPEGERGRRGGGRDRDRDNDGGDRPAEAKPAPPPAATSTANSFGTTSDTERFRKQATDIINLHDKNNNKFLDGEEVEKMGMSKAADTDQDGVITHNDLVAFYSKSAAGSAASKPAETASKPSVATTAKSAEGDGKTERVIVNKSRKSYRFKSTKDRIDNWKFSSRDANGDGQVSMSEYSRSWTDRTASEFNRYDKDSDGMITSAEAK